MIFEAIFFEYGSGKLLLVNFVDLGPHLVWDELYHCFLPILAIHHIKCFQQCLTSLCTQLWPTNCLPHFFFDPCLDTAKLEIFPPTLATIPRVGQHYLMKQAWLTLVGICNLLKVIILVVNYYGPHSCCQSRRPQVTSNQGYVKDFLGYTTYDHQRNLPLRTTTLQEVLQLYFINRTSSLVPWSSQNGE